MRDKCCVSADFFVFMASGVWLSPAGTRPAGWAILQQWEWSPQPGAGESQRHTSPDTLPFQHRVPLSPRGDPQQDLLGRVALLSTAFLSLLQHPYGPATEEHWGWGHFCTDFLLPLLSPVPLNCANPALCFKAPYPTEPERHVCYW